MPAPATVASQLLGEIIPRLNDPLVPMEPEELRTALARLRRAQRNAETTELAQLFNVIGSVCFRLREYKEALDAHRNAARYDTRNASYQSNVACCLIELKHCSQALDALRDANARPVKPPGIEIAILLNISEAHHYLGNHEASRSAFEEALRRVDQARSLDLVYMACTAAVLGAEDDAVEFFARSLAVAKGVDLGEIPAIEFVRANPDHLKAASSRSSALETAIVRVGERYDDSPPPEHQLVTQITLPDTTLSAVLDLVEHAPEPTETLRELFHEPRP